MGYKIMIGLLLVLLGFMLLISSLASEMHFAGLIMIGPIPVIVSSSDTLIPLIIILGLILLIFALVLLRW
ncbi:MAG: DUF131 domain-containing protein [Archaeoglobaceae archaeon]|nr:DUF131 domain-containing protein [Archaeoglobaceae archaeon]MCX8151557.1 DUF131 domain-containing protein [Archaeoglobaceae archaeon]MDW8013165.1 DUF131 domain-containing protein [Archaeoglobaceae archaeon]